MSTPSICILITEDPGASPRPAEALRIALGMSIGENDLRIVLCGAGVRLLQERWEDLPDGDKIARHRKLLVQHGRSFRAEDTALAGLDWDSKVLPVEPIDRNGIARLISTSDRTIVF